jgi:hypothetical protein
MDGICTSCLVSEKVQPWRSHWPPKNTHFHILKYDVKRGGIAIYGVEADSGATPAEEIPEIMRCQKIVCSGGNSEDVLASMYFLAKDKLYETVKAYNLRYSPGVEFPKTNIKREIGTVTVRDMRGFEKMFSLDRNGFQVVKFNSKLTYEDFTDPAKVEETYLHEMRVFLQGFFGGDHIEIYEHAVKLSLQSSRPTSLS